MTTTRQLTPALLLALAASCSSGSSGGGPVTTPPPASAVGGPIDGLTPAELAAFDLKKLYTPGPEGYTDYPAYHETA